jgi:DNA-binding response OmpR family regulator
MNILVVEDEKKLADSLCEILRSQKYNCDVVYNGADGLDYAETGIYDVIVLDVMLPKLSGFDIIKALRAKHVNTPIIILTALDDISDKIVGLDYGADDYMTKPFVKQELLARIRALSRRKGDVIIDEITFGDLKLSRDTYSLICNEESISLGKKEFQIMEVLISYANKTVNKERLLEKIWGFDSDAEYNAIEVYVSFLRKKMTALGSKTQIRSIRGVGYILENGND